MSPLLQTRRAFLRTATAGFGAALALPSAPRAAARRRDETVGFAVAGLGGLSTWQILPALRATRFARLAGVVTGTPEKGRRAVEQYGIPSDAVYSYDTMDRMADNPDIDVVYVVTPNVLHLDHAAAAARAGKHVFCEKPMAGSAADCESMIGACRDAGVRLAVAYRCQFEPHHRECMRIARDGDFGPLRLVEAGLGFRIGDPAQWRLRRDLAGGGALMDVGVYAIQACRYLSGEEPVRITATESKTDPVKFAEVDETIAWHMDFPSGAVGSCTASYNLSGLNHFRGYCERGSFWMDPAYSYGDLEGGSSRGRFDIEPVNHFAAEMDDFARCILEDRESIVPGEEGLRDLRIIEAIYEAVRTGGSVRLP
jgi:predicted dehydrogenase